VLVVAQPLLVELVLLLQLAFKALAVVVTTTCGSSMIWGGFSGKSAKIKI
jgi:hypothetical protein